MEKEFNLTEKINNGFMYEEEDVKEFIKRLKNEITHLLDNEQDSGGLKSRALIDKLAGKELIWKQ